MKYVEIYQLQNNGTQKTVVVCNLENETVICEGDENIINSFKKEGILNYSESPPNKLFLNDGLKFLEQLKYNFKSGYLNGSDVKEK